MLEKKAMEWGEPMVPSAKQVIFPIPFCIQCTGERANLVTGTTLCLLCYLSLSEDLKMRELRQLRMTTEQRAAFFVNWTLYSVEKHGLISARHLVCFQLSKILLLVYAGTRGDDFPVCTVENYRHEG